MPERIVNHAINHMLVTYPENSGQWSFFEGVENEQAS